MGREYAAFISYSSRYSEWVSCLHRNLELALASHGESRKVFLDQSEVTGRHANDNGVIGLSVYQFRKCPFRAVAAP